MIGPATATGWSDAYRGERIKWCMVYSKLSGVYENGECLGKKNG